MTPDGQRTTHIAPATVRPLRNHIKGDYRFCPEAPLNDAVLTRPISHDAIPLTARFVAQFAERHANYGRRLAACDYCGMCDLAESPRTLPLSSVAEWRNCAPSLSPQIVAANEYPYLRNQVLAFPRQHREAVEVGDLLDWYALLTQASLRGLAIQVRGSGATVPDHCHAAIFDEDLPIFYAQPATTDGARGFNGAETLEYPGFAVRWRNGQLHKRFEAALELCRQLIHASLSYNLYVESDGTVILVGRRAEYATSIARKVGAATAAGMFLAYTEGLPGTAPRPMLIDAMLDRYARITGGALMGALRETLLPWDEASSLLH